MEFRYISVHKVQGISQNPGNSDILLVERPDIDMRAVLAGDVDAHCYLLDRERALAQMMLTGGLNDDNFDEVLRSRVKERHDDRRRKMGNSAALVIEGSGDVDTRIEEPMRDLGEFLICFDPIDQEAIKERYRPVITILMASLSIASSESHKVEKVAEGLYLIDEAGKVILSSLGWVELPHIAQGQSSKKWSKQQGFTPLYL